MDYFRMEQTGSVVLGKQECSREGDVVFCKVEEVSVVKGLDYLSEQGLISDRLKTFLERIPPRRDWKPYVFVDLKKQKQEVFWQLEVETYDPEEIRKDKTGRLAGIRWKGKEVPRLFQIRLEKGSSVVILHLSLVECMFRHGILGVDLLPVELCMEEE